MDSPTRAHDERCKACKTNVKSLLVKLYGKVEGNCKLDAGTRPEDFRAARYYSQIKEIYETLQQFRGFGSFVKSSRLPRVDFFIPNPGFLVEFDESQHFTVPRKIALEHYPDGLQLGFSRERWITLAENLHKKDNDPPYRDEQRAWYDTIRDFLPSIIDLRPTARLFAKDFAWCSLDAQNDADLSRFSKFLLGNKN